MDLLTLAVAVFGGLVVLVKRFVTLPGELDPVLGAVVALLSQVVVYFTVVNVDSRNVVELILKLTLAVLTALGIVALPAATRVTKRVVIKVFRG